VFYIAPSIKEEYAMRCPSCGYIESKVIDSRPVEEGNSIRRRRECLSCQKRFTTFEVVEALQIVVVKKDGSKELFDRTKLLGGILKATQKRPVDAEQLAAEIESELHNSLRREIPSIELGEMVMNKLKVTDEVAYVRFASVYREFRDLNSFLEELHDLKQNQN
jgi:transcriptional repressor NrdR